MGGFALNGTGAAVANLLAMLLMLTVVSEAPAQAGEVADAAG
jgi:hypothetical protein